MMTAAERAFALAVVAFLAGCCTQPVAPPPVVTTYDTGCAWTKPVTVKASDDKETIRQAIEWAKTWNARCLPK